MSRRHLALAVLALCLSGFQGANAEPSAFGCSDLAENDALPALEGKDGFFFRLDADIRMQNIMTDAGADEVARFAAALKENGTTLVYAPIPTKGQTLEAFLPDSARFYGFDSSVAQSTYRDQIQKLTDRGVVAVDLIPALELWTILEQRDILPG